MKFGRLMALAVYTLSLSLGEDAHAQVAENAVTLPTDVWDLHLFTENPAVANPDKFGLGYMQVQRKRHIKNKFIWGNTVDPKAKYRLKETNHALGLMFPLGGGAALGLNAEMLNADYDSQLNTERDSNEEHLHKKYLSARFVVKLVDKVSAGLGLRYMVLDHDILGQFFANDNDDRISYKGSMTGFNVGLYYLDGPLSLGVAYTPPMRGKASIGDEKIIVSESGYLNLDLGYGKERDYRFALAAKRWLHKRDDRSEPYRLPNTERSIWLNGLDFEQFLFPVIQYGIGLDTVRYGDFFFRFALSQTEYVFLFDGESVPGDEPDRETKVRALGGKIAAVYAPSDFSIHVGFAYEKREKGTIAPGGGFADRYEDYDSTEKSLFAAFNYRR